jgi:hypothetical protein
MSLFSLPKEVRLDIWALAYFSQPPRLVALRTKLHDETHDENTFCPRYSPSPAPKVVNICHEARAEAHYQARKAGHLIRLHDGPLSPVPQYTEEFYFRFAVDILYIPLEDERVKHFDDSPEVGLLSHFRRAVDCDTSLLRNVAITQVVSSGFYDGSLSNCLREFPTISRLIMMVPERVWQGQSPKSMFVRAALRILRMYQIDTYLPPGDMEGIAYVDVDFATLVDGELVFIPKENWLDWSEVSHELCRWSDRSQVIRPFENVIYYD